jgi:putative ABC transport system substrate-binding protein
MRRRAFITLLGGAAAGWPLMARAQQQPNLRRRLGILMPLAEAEEEPQAWISALLDNLQTLGWKKNENLAIDLRWGGGDAVRLPAFAAELAASQPDVLVGNGTVALGALKQAAPSTPIIFVNVIDPVSSGMVKSLAAPGGNMTGFTNLQTSMAGKWLELLKQLKPGLDRALVIANLDNPAMASLLNELNRVGSTLSIAAIPGGVRTRPEIDAVIHEFGSGERNGALVVLPDLFTSAHYAEIIALSARYRLPAVYPFRFFATGGGLLSYGVDVRDLYRRAASYVDRILRGASPAELPVQQPTKFELVINLKTAKTLGLDVPPMLLAFADEVIE